VHVANLVVHDLYIVSSNTNSGTAVTTLRLAVRAIKQTILFTRTQTYFDTSKPNIAWFESYKDKCSSSPQRAAVSGKSTPSVSAFNPGSATSHTFDFSNGFRRSCTSSSASGFSRHNNFDTVEEQFFYRLCFMYTSTPVVVWDFQNVMVTVTDIEVLADYRNPIVDTGMLSPIIKFKESCGFLWLERKWNVQSSFHFVVATKQCTTYPNAGAGPDHSSEVKYTMYNGDLIKYFLDDANYESTVTFNNPTYRTPYRLCLNPHEETGIWIDYPHVALYPVAGNGVLLTSKNDNYATVSQCPEGWLGCKCLNNGCTQRWHRKSQAREVTNDKPYIEMGTSSCETIGSEKLCVGPSTVIWGAPAFNKECPPSSPCSNPGPNSGRDNAQIYVTFDSNNLKASDQVQFVPSNRECTTDAPGNAYGSGYVTVPQDKSLIKVNTKSLSSGSVYHRMCVKEASNGYVLDYHRTGFTLNGVATQSPTRSTFKPTNAARGSGVTRGVVKTYSPTMAIPQFFDRTGLLTTFNTNPALPQNLNVLYIVTPEDSQSNVLYTQWTNWTYGTVASGDTLRIYRDTPSILGTDPSSLNPPSDSICSHDWLSQHKLMRSTDLVMEVQLSQAGNAPGVAASVQFPALAKGYYTACFCRLTPSHRCQMSAAGMIYSSAARMVSVTGAGTKDATFRVTPLLDYEITPDLFNTTQLRYITAAHFCLSNATSSKLNACGSCRVQGFDTQGTQPQEFDIQLTSGSFPLTITNKVEHGTTDQNRVFNLCFKDPMLMQFEGKMYNSTHMRSTRPDVNATYWVNGWDYGLIGKVYLSDLNFQWEQNGGFSVKRSSYSIQKSKSTMVKISYSGSSQVINSGDQFWFMDSQYDCSPARTNDQTSALSVPYSGRIFYLSFSTNVAGRFYRMCLKPLASGSQVRDFGVDFGLWITDIMPSAVNFKFFKAFHLSLSSDQTLVAGDEFFSFIPPNYFVVSTILFELVGFRPMSEFSIVVFITIWARCRK